MSIDYNCSFNDVPERFLSQAEEPKVAGLHSEIRQNKPFHSLDQEAYLALIRTADEAKRRYHDLFERAGVTMQQYNVLRILRGAGPEGMPTLAVGERMIERTPGVTRLVDRMERKGWVTRHRCSEDRRVVWCRITSGGLEMLERLDDPVRQVDNTHFGALKPDELGHFVAYLDRVRADMRSRQEGGS